MLKKIRLITIASISLCFVACSGLKNDTKSDNEVTVEIIETSDNDNKIEIETDSEDSSKEEKSQEKQEYDSKNAYEYAKLESLLQSLKKDTDDVE